MVVVYAKPNCPPCAATKRWLNKRGVKFDEYDVSKDHEALEYVLSLGAKETPVVTTEDGWWTGYRPDRLEELL